MSPAVNRARRLTPIMLPALNLVLALALSAIVVVLVGEHPGRALRLLVVGAFGDGEAIGYTLYYATSFVFTGLAVAVAFHGGLFNIGAEGQASLGGLGVALLCLAAGGWPTPLVIAAAIVVAGVFGAAWAFVPAWLQARRGSHVVITTIMFNFLAAALMTYLLVNVIIRPGQQIPETAVFPESAWIPQLHEILAAFGIKAAPSPLNLSFVIALVCCLLVWLFVWQTRYGYALRVVGQNEAAAVYGGISPARQIMLAMTLSGALAGLVALNMVLGAEHRLTLDFTGGFGFVGIAVSLMGRNHPVGIVLAALLFGALYQGGSELSFDMPALSRDLVVVIQGLVILFAGALEHMFRPWLEALFARPAPAEAVA
jgi:simple sugar transport system permease protein